MMKFVVLVALVLSSDNILAQRFELLFGIGPTYSNTAGNIDYTIAPDYFPTITFEDARNPGVFKTKTIDWISNRNYFGFEPSIEFGYHISKKFTLGLGFFGRHRQLDYELFLPGLDGLSVYSHHFELNFTFLASLLYLKYHHPKQKWNITFNIGFNHPLNSLEDEGKFVIDINNLNVIEDVVGPVKSSHGLLAFTNYPLYRISFNRNLSKKFELGLFVEKQFKNYYGADIRIRENTSGQRVLLSSVYGNDLTLGLKLCFNLMAK